MHGTNIFVFGGFGSGQWYNTVSILDTKDMTWRKRLVKGEVPCKRYAHVAAQDDGKMYVFGGFGGAQGQYLNDIFALDVETLEWRRVQPDGEPPCPRAAAAAAYDPSSRTWFIHGGNAGDHRLNDLHALNLRTLQWRRIGGLQVDGNSPGSAQIGPGPRAGHTLTLVGTELHLFGGGDTSALDVPEMGDVFNDHYVFDLHNMDWASPEVHWRCPPADGVPPAPRAGHGAAAVGKHIYIVGGHGHKPCQEDRMSTARFLNDVHALNIETNEWRQCVCGGAVPTPRAGFALLERGGTLYVAGGGDAQSVRNDLVLLDVSQMVDFPLDADDEPPSGSVLFVPGLEQKLKKRMKKADLVHKNILKQTSVGSDGLSGSQEWWAARASVERKQLDQKLGRFLQNRNDAEHLRQRNILKQERVTIDPKLGGVVLELEKAHRTRDLERLLQNRKSPDEVARQLARNEAEQEEEDVEQAEHSGGAIGAWGAVPSKQTSDQADADSNSSSSNGDLGSGGAAASVSASGVGGRSVAPAASTGEGVDPESPMSRMWPKLPTPALPQLSLRERERTSRQQAQQQKEVCAEPNPSSSSAAALAVSTAEAPLSAGEMRRLNRVLAFQKRGEEKKRLAAAAAAASSVLRTELQLLPRSQLRKRALRSGVSEQELLIDAAEDGCSDSYAAFIDLVVDRELRPTPAAGSSGDDDKATTGDKNRQRGRAGNNLQLRQDQVATDGGVETCRRLRLEPALPATPPRAGAVVLGNSSSSSSSSSGTSARTAAAVAAAAAAAAATELNCTVLSSAEVQELCESIAAELGSFRHLCKEEEGAHATWIESERRLLRLLHEKLRDDDYATPASLLSPASRGVRE
jgi:N-acetylneuraminic acid mutarotase